MLPPRNRARSSKRRQARQLVRHGHVAVNGRKVNIPSFEVAAGQEITILELTHMIAVTAALDLDYVGAHLAHDSRTGRARHEMREIENAVAFEHPERLSHLMNPLAVS